MVSSLTIYETLRHAGVNEEMSKILATKVDVEKSTRTVITTIFGFLIGFAALILAGVYFLIQQTR